MMKTIFNVRSGNCRGTSSTLLTRSMYRGRFVSGGRVLEMDLVNERDRMLRCGGSVPKNQLSSYLFISPKTSTPISRQRKSEAVPFSFFGRNDRFRERLLKAAQVAISQNSSASCVAVPTPDRSRLIGISYRLESTNVNETLEVSVHNTQILFAPLGMRRSNSTKILFRFWVP